MKIEKVNGQVVVYFFPDEYQTVMDAVGEYQEYLEGRERFAQAREVERMWTAMYEATKKETTK